VRWRCPKKACRADSEHRLGGAGSWPAGGLPTRPRRTNSSSSKDFRPPSGRKPQTELYLEDLRKMNDSSIDDLANSVRALNESLSHPEAPSNASLFSKGGVSDDVNTLKAALNGLEVSIENPNPVIVRDSGDFVTLRANILQAQQQLSIADRLCGEGQCGGVQRQRGRRSVVSEEYVRSGRPLRRAGLRARRCEESRVYSNGPRQFLHQ